MYTLPLTLPKIQTAEYAAFVFDLFLQQISFILIGVQSPLLHGTMDGSDVTSPRTRQER